jgi:hypothetical protein
MLQTTIGLLIVIVIAICEGLKFAKFPTRYIPLAAIALAIIGAIAVGGLSWLQVSAGVVLGLASSGLYSGFRSTILNK